MSDTPILGGNAEPPANNLVKDATIETFQTDVMDASTQVPVIVDFWASWCGPCKTLGPILEKAVQARGGKVKMVKVDTDKNQMLAQQLRIQSLPTVMAFVQGQPVDGFMGAVPESEVNAFVDRIIAGAEQMGLKGGGVPGAPDPADLIATAEQAIANQDLQSAIVAYSQVLDVAEDNADARVEAMAGIARVQAMAGDVEAARATLSQLPMGFETHPAVAQISAQLDLAQQDAPPSELAALQQAHVAHPENQDAALAYAEGQIGAGQMSEAMDTLLAMIERDREWNEGAAKEKLLTVFEALGAADPDVKRARRRLSSVLFS